MEKYELIPWQLLHEGSFSKYNFFVPEPMPFHVIRDVHCSAYIQKLENLRLTRQEERRTGFPMSRQLLDREICITHGTIQGALYANENGVAFNIAGGTHHAFRDRGEGFCIFNDIAVAANYLQENKKANRILIVDLDVHQGNGTAKIFANNNWVYTFSMHARKNFPLTKEVSDLDMFLDNDTNDAAYLDKLQPTLNDLIDHQKPDFIFYQAGVDILENDKLGKLAITRKGCYERDHLVLEAAFRKGIPTMVVMGGGYAPQIKDIIEAHCNTYRIAKGLYG